MLCYVVEFDVAGPGDLKPTECAQGDNIGPEAVSGSIGVELYRGVHCGGMMV